MPDWNAATLQVANGPDGRKYIAVDDLVTMVRDMAAKLQDGPAKNSLTMLGDTFASMTDLASPPTMDDGSRPVAYRCPDCRQPVIDAIKGIGEDDSAATVTVDANHARYGDWLVLRVREGKVTVAPYEHGRHDGATDSMVRLRTHRCAPGTMSRG